MPRSSAGGFVSCPQPHISPALGAGLNQRAGHHSLPDTRPRSEHRGPGCPRLPSPPCSGHIGAVRTDLLPHLTRRPEELAWTLGKGASKRSGRGMAPAPATNRGLGLCVSHQGASPRPSISTESVVCFDAFSSSTRARKRARKRKGFPRPCGCAPGSPVSVPVPQASGGQGRD